MKQIKQWHRVALIAAVLSLVCSVSVGAYDFSANNIYYNINEKTLTAEVTYASDSYNSYNGSVVIPATVENNGKVYDVTAVGDNAFRDCSGLTGVEFGANVATIGKRAFLNCSHLNRVTITGGIVEIGDYAFAQCGALKLVTMNNDAPLQIGAGAFMHCSTLKSVKWDSSEALDGRGGLTSLGTNAFAHCPLLTKMLLPGNVQYLGTTIFEGCTGIQYIIVTAEQPLALSGDPFALDNSTIIYVPSSGQKGVTGNLYKTAMWWGNYRIIELTYTFYDHDDYIYLKTSTGAVSLIGSLKSKTDVVVRNSITGFSGENYNVTSISDQAFKGSGITSLNTSNAFMLKAIGSESFAGCASLTAVSLVEGITMMGDSAFASCTALDSIQLPSTLRTVPRGAFDGCSSLNKVNIVLGVCTISENAFAHCTGLTTLSLPRSITSVEAYALNGSTALEEIVVDPYNPYYASIEGVLYERKYGDGFVYNVSNKMNKLVVYPSSKTGEMLYVPAGVTEIISGAVQNVTQLKKVALPPSTIVFAENCFEGTGIQTFNYRSKNPVNEGTAGITAAIKANATLQVPIGTTSEYQSLSSWQGFKAIVERYDVLDDDQFVYDWNTRDQVTLVDIKPAAVNVGGLLTLPQGMNLDGCDYFITELSNTCTAQVAQDVMRLKINCDSLAVIDMTDDINPISALTSLQVISLTSTNPYFVLEDDVLYNSQGTHLYYYLQSNTRQTFTMPDAIDTIMPQAFAQNKSLKVITLNKFLKCLGNKAFEGCTGLEVVNNMIDVTYIGYRTFAGCTALTSVNGGEWLNIIGREAFLNCSSLQQFPFAHGMLVEIGDHAFKGCSALSVAVFNNKIHTIGVGAFENCTALSKVFFSAEVSNMQQQLFKGCNSLSEMWLCNSAPPQVGNDFFGSLSGLTLYVPQEATNAYHTIAPWSSASQVKSCCYLDNGPDVNNDKYVNAFDVTLVYSVLLGKIDGDIVGHCDVNHDGAVTAADITTIYQYILNGSGLAMAYRFMGNNDEVLFQYVTMTGEHQKIKAFDFDTNNYVTSGLLGLSDHTQVATIVLGTTQGIPYLEIVPVAPGYFTMVAIVNNGAAYYYRVFPMVVR
ncbi:MAG: leucine-rich repeat protein [Muribaculaceae bacterium]|nr:leucine-rich repeat protein [Muribaculaceae bacterium]